MKSSRAALLRQTSTLLTVLLAALALSSCGVFHHPKKPAKKKAANKHQVQQAQPKPKVASPTPPKQAEPPRHTESEPTNDLPAPPKTPSTYPVAKPVPGKPNMVFSPFNNRPIDVEGIESGKLVADPTYPASEKKYFRVP